MPTRHGRFVTLCQQLLVLGVICAALTPAANLLNLDIVPDRAGAGARADGAAGHGAGPLSMSAYVRAQDRASQVPVGVVDPKVKEVPLTAPAGARVAPSALAARRVQPTRHGGAELLSEPQHVSGYGGVGVTWAHGETVPVDDISLQVRTRRHGAWSDWQPMAYHDEHGPDPDSAEGRRARPGTDEVLVGDVGKVQVKIAAADGLPTDLKLAVIDPGTPRRTAMERPALDTQTLDGSAGDAPQAAPGPSSSTDGGTTSGTGLTLSRAVYTPKPVIYSRAQWGADERMRDKASLHYYEVHAGFVHHTVTANGYTRDQVPGIIRSIYAYHTQSQGWSDIGYNFLVDRFGRIWEGRAGGVDRAVVGAHTLGFNDNAFAASAIGNYDVTRPSKAMVQAYGALFGWKLSLYGVDASSTHQYVTSRYFQAINGHRDANPTECPGRYLYAKLPQIRKLAAAAQQGWSGRQLESDVTSTPQPDLVVRRASDRQAVVIPLRQGKDGSIHTGRPVATGLDLTGVDRLMSAGDWDRDGHTDLVFRRADTGDLYLSRGSGTGRFGAPTLLARGFGDVHLLAAVGDMTGDGWPDLMGQRTGGDMTIWAGNGLQGFKSHYPAYGAVRAERQIGIGLWDGDGAPDSLFRTGPKVALLRGDGPGGLTGSAQVFGKDFKPYDWTIGISDVGLTGHPDLVVRTKKTGQLWLIKGTQKGLGKPLLIGTGMQAYDMSG